jgi:thiazole synthase ThiGH ThiG subunit
MEDKLIIAGHEFNSRFILGSGKFDLDLINAAVEHAGAEIITLALRRVNSFSGNILEHIPKGVTLLPNTSGARNAEEAVKIGLQGRQAAENLSKSRLFTTRNISCPTTTKRLRLAKFLQTRALFPCRICTLTSMPRAIW